MLCLMAVALAPRLYWASGLGLADDWVFRGEVASILNGHVYLDNQAYRFTWWFPTAFSCRLFGLTEYGLIAPFTFTATLGVALVYLLGKACWDRRVGIVAALLLAVTPLDFAWATMMTNDIMLSFWSGVTILCALRAVAANDPAWRRRLWILAGGAFWLTFHLKLSAVFLLPVIGVLCLVHRPGVDRHALCFVATVAVLLVLSSVVLYVFTGDPFFHYTSELKYQGLSGPDAGRRRLEPFHFWYFPEQVFTPNHLGNFVFSVYPYVLAGGLVLGRLLGLPGSRLVLAWLLIVFLGMQFNVQRADGIWVSGFRNVRHLHCLVYPLVLLTAACLVALRQRWRLATDVVTVALLVFGAWQSVSTARKTQIAFADRRQACTRLVTLTDKPRYADDGIVTWCTVLDPTNGQRQVLPLPDDPGTRGLRLQEIDDAYVVTGGAREPHYGCRTCITSTRDFLEPERWRLVEEFPDPVPSVPWREEPLRIWATVAPATTPQ
jgi:4-amino-4-deoxy-L-arabinose transferase-like glycosyltransferase